VLALVASAEEVEDLADVRRQLAVERLVLLHRHRQRPLAAEQLTVSRVEGADLLGAGPGAGEADFVEAADLVGAVDLDERRDVVVDPAGAA
jgi:hypothetical protein